MTKAANDNHILINFINNLPSTKDIRVYAPGEAKKLPATALNPALNRLLMRERNTKES